MSLRAIVCGFPRAASSPIAASRLFAKRPLTVTSTATATATKTSVTPGPPAAPHLEEAASTLSSLERLIRGSPPLKTGRPIYLDFQATTPVDPRVLDAMLPFFTEMFGNAHSRTHSYGWEASDAVEQAREHIASLIGADSKEIIFTSGATESNNMAIKGVARFYKKTKHHIITCQTEHKCVLDSCRAMEQDGCEVTYLPVQSNGIIDLELLEKSIRKDTAIVSVMTVNNEIGVIQPIKEIGEICRKRGVFFHTDAAQALGKIPINVNEMNIDLMSMSGHKIYGPRGIGALYVRRKAPRVRIEPILSGGGQERGLRSGTLPASLVIGFGEACKVAREEMPRDIEHVSKLSQRL